MTTSPKVEPQQEAPAGNRGRGRPRQLAPEERESLILDAMERVLTVHGLDGASMAAIAREAGMSKRTIYQVFDSRARLFTACIRRIRLSFVRPLAGTETAFPLRERLRHILIPDVHLAASEMPVAVLRAVVVEAKRYPDLASAFLEEGPNAAREVVRSELERATANGEIRPVDTTLAARILCDMVYECPIDRMIAPENSLRDPTEVENRFQLALDIFVKGMAPGASPSPGPIG